MSIFNELLPLAAQVRDATEEGENTGKRVGDLFVDIIQEIESYVTNNDEDKRDTKNELIKRIQGRSESSDALRDSFKFLGEFNDPNDADLLAALDGLHSVNKEDGYEGVWRVSVAGKPSVLYNFAMNYPQDKWLQGLITVYSPHTNPAYVFTINNRVNFLCRTLENGVWSKWRSITQDNADAILAEKNRATEAEQSITESINTEVTRAKDAETELLARLQGKSENSNPRTDPFKYLGNFSNINGDDLKAALDALHTTNPNDNIEGLWRATLYYGVLEIQCIAIHYATDRWVQILKSPYRWVKSTGKFDINSNPRYRILYRIFENPNGENSTENNTWGDWHDVEQELEDATKANSTAIANEITRAKAEEAAIRTLISDLIGESPETLDTIHEIAAWILNDTTGAAAMAKQITENKAANEELLLRLQGKSENSNAVLDPFKFLGEFNDPNDADFLAALDGLHSVNKEDGYEGVWRVTVAGKPSVLYNFAMNYPQDKWLQGLITVYSPHTNPAYIFTINNRVNLLCRTLENGVWGKWRSVTQDNADEILAEKNRATEAEQSILNVIPRKRNYVTVVGNEAFVISKYNAEYDIIVQFAHTMKNELYSIKRVYLTSNTGEKLSTDHTRPVAVLLSSQEASDMIGPVAVRTTGGSFFVGGNHLYPNQEGVKSAKTNSYAIYADEKTVSAGSCYADTVTIKVCNTIFDPAEVSSDGLLSSPLIEECTSFAVDCGQISIAVEHRYMKDASVGRYYGMQSMFTKGAEFITAQGGYSNWKANEETRILKGDAPLLNRFSQRTTDGYYQNTVLLPYGLGTHEYVSDEQEVFIWTGAKAYHVLIRDREIPAGAKLAWMGVYNWNSPIVDDENNYIYTYKVDGKEFVSITAKQTYSNVSVAMPARLSNTLYRALESDKNITLNDIITSNLVLTAESTNSVLGTCVEPSSKLLSDNVDNIAANLRGEGEDINASTFPFVNLGNMQGIGNLVAYPETIIDNNGGEVDIELSTAMISGVYRASIRTSLYEMKLNVLVLQGVLTQTITGILSLTDGVLSIGTADVITVERYYQNSNGWSKWKIVASAEKLEELLNKIISLEARINVLEEYHNGITANVADNNLSLTGECNVVDGNLNVVGSNVTIVDNNLIIK